MNLIELRNGLPRHPDFQPAAPVSFSLEDGEAVCIYGHNGAGKSLLVKMITGALPLRSGHIVYSPALTDDGGLPEQLRTISFHDAFGALTPEYHQQRWNHGDEKTYPTVRELLHDSPLPIGEQSASHAALPIDDLLDKPLNWLSSGELRRFQLVKALRKWPRVLIVEEPFIGLDADARRSFTQLLGHLSKQVGLLLVVSKPGDIPAFADRVVEVRKLHVKPAMKREQFLSRPVQGHSHELTDGEREEITVLSATTEPPRSETLIDLHHVSVSYFGKDLLSDVSWTVREGEHWALTGSNGAGKSTLLSLICADNPMAYACDIRLFGYRRGHGESIWDIKRHIGYVSPEQYRSFRRDLSVTDLVGTGLHDTHGLHRLPTEAEREHAGRWLRLFHAGHLAARSFLRLSEGEQRLVLLVRAFVKAPALLVLDEPFHGLDTATREHAKAVIAHYLRQTHHTLLMVSHEADDFPESISHHLHLNKGCVVKKEGPGSC